MEYEMYTNAKSYMFQLEYMNLQMGKRKYNGCKWLIQDDCVVNCFCIIS